MSGLFIAVNVDWLSRQHLNWQPAQTEFPTALPIDPADYQGWWTYTHPVYGFSIMLPEDWDVEEVTTGDPLMNGHLLNLHPDYASGMENIRMTFRRVGEDVLLWPTGVGSGEFIPQGTIDIAGAPARRILFVCPNGEITGIWYHDAEENQPNITRGDLEFGFIYSNSYCEPGYSLGGKVQRCGRDDHRLAQGAVSGMENDMNAQRGGQKAFRAYSSMLRSTLLLFLLAFPVYFMFLVFHEGGHALHTLAMGGPVSMFYVHPFPMAGYALPPFDWENVWFHAAGATMVLLVSLLIFILCWRHRSVSLLPLVMFFPWAAIVQGFVMLMVMDDFNNIVQLTGLSPIIFQVTGLILVVAGIFLFVSLFPLLGLAPEGPQISVRGSCRFIPLGFGRSDRRNPVRARFTD